jgi:hypothetical protein
VEQVLSTVPGKSDSEPASNGLLIFELSCKYFSDAIISKDIEAVMMDGVMQESHVAERVVFDGTGSVEHEHDLESFEEGIGDMKSKLKNEDSGDAKKNRKERNSEPSTLFPSKLQRFGNGNLSPKRAGGMKTLSACEEHVVVPSVKYFGDLKDDVFPNGLQSWNEMLEIVNPGSAASIQVERAHIPENLLGSPNSVFSMSTNTISKTSAGLEHTIPPISLFNPTSTPASFCQIISPPSLCSSYHSFTPFTASSFISTCPSPDANSPTSSISVVNLDAAVEKRLVESEAVACDGSFSVSSVKDIPSLTDCVGSVSFSEKIDSSMSTDSSSKEFLKRRKERLLLSFFDPYTCTFCHESFGLLNHGFEEMEKIMGMFVLFLLYLSTLV